MNQAVFRIQGIWNRRWPLRMIVLIDEIRSPCLSRSSRLVVVDVIGGIRYQSHGLVRMIGVVNENFEIAFKRAQIALVSAHVIADRYHLVCARVAISLQAERDWGAVIEKRSKFLESAAVARLQTPVEKFAVPCAARV